MVMLEPETLAEAGMCQWLATRFHGKKVTLVFDTSTENERPTTPALWVHLDEESK